MIKLGRKILSSSNEFGDDIRQEARPSWRQVQKKSETEIETESETEIGTVMETETRAESETVKRCKALMVWYSRVRLEFPNRGRLYKSHFSI